MTGDLPRSWQQYRSYPQNHWSAPTDLIPHTWIQGSTKNTPPPTKKQQPKVSPPADVLIVAQKTEAVTMGLWPPRPRPQIKFPPPAQCFATTHWSNVVAAQRSDTLEAAAGLEKLCRTYWCPLEQLADAVSSVASSSHRQHRNRNRLRLMFSVQADSCMLLSWTGRSNKRFGFSTRLPKQMKPTTPGIANSLATGSSK